MPVEVAQGILNITPSMNGLQALIDREMRGVNSRRAGQQAGDEYQGGFGASAKKLTGILAGAFAAVKIGDFAKSAIDQASDLNEVGTKMQVVFGDANAQVQEFASQGAKALGLSSLEAQNAAASFGVFGKSAGLAGKDQADFSTGMAKLAVDMASFSNTTPEDAIEALSSGLRGEAEPLRKYGVLLDDASLRQEALSMGLITTTKEALTPQQKVLASHALIMKQTSDAQGDFERTSGGLANQQRILSAQWTDMKGKLGAAFLPAVNATVTALNDNLFPALEGIGTKASTAFAGVRPQLEAAWNILRAGDFPGASAGLGEEDSPLVNALLTAHDLFGRVGPTLKEAWSILAGGDFKGGLGFEEDSPFVDFMFKLRDVGLDVFGKVKDIWDQLWSLGEKLWPSIESIAESFYDAWKTINDSGWSGFALVFDGIKLAVDGLITVLNATLVPALDWLARFFRENPAEVYLLVGAFTAWKVAMLAQSTATWLVQAATKAWAVAQGILNAVMDANPITLVIVAIAALAAGIIWAYNNVDWFREAVDKAWSFIKTATNALWENALKPAFEWLSDNIHLVGDFFIAMWEAAQPVFDFLKTSFDNFLAVIQGVIDVLVGVFTGDWSKAWEGVKKIAGAVWDQIVAYVSLAWDLITGIGGKILDWLGSFGGWAWERIVALTQTVVGWGQEFLTWLWDGIKNVAVSVFQWFADLPATAWAGVVALTSTIIGYGGSFIGWIKDGIVSGAEAIWTFIKDIPNQIWNFISNLSSKIFDIGKNLVGWIVEGIKSVAATIWDAITSALTGDGEKIGDDGLPTTGPRVLGKRDGGFVTAAGTIFRADGGPVVQYAPNGFISGPGGSREDKIPTMLSNGEYVVNAKSTAMFGPELEMMNAIGHMANGGLVGTRERAITLGGELAWAAADKAVRDFKAAAPAVPGSNGNWGPGVTGGFAANTAAAKAYIEAHFSGVSSIGGLYGGSVPGSDHPMGKALDVMIANYRSAAGIAAGNAIADWFQNNANAFGTKYEIWRKQYREPGKPWGPYSHPSGSNDTLDHFDHVHISFLTGSGQFAGGQTVADDKPIGAFGDIVSKLQSKFAPAGSPVAYTPTAGVEQWRGLSLQALTAVGNYLGRPLTQHIDRLLMQMGTESSGNPNAINLTDSNARKGTPSIGLLQTIQPTFEGALRGTPFANLIPRGPRDPWANIIASILYGEVTGPYHSLEKAYRGVAYEKGGIVPGLPWMGADSIPGMLTPGEGVFTKPQTDAIITHAKALEAGFSGQNVVVNNYIDGQQLDARTEILIDGVLWDAAREYTRAGAQS